MICEVLMIICLEMCKRCGLIGSEESFYGRFKNYCSVKCAQSVHVKQQSQPTTAAAPSPQVVNIVMICSQNKETRFVKNSVIMLLCSLCQNNFPIQTTCDVLLVKLLVVVCYSDTMSTAVNH